MQNFLPHTSSKSGRPPPPGSDALILELQRAREQLERFAGIVESSDDAIISKTLQGIVTSCNRGAEKIFGYASSELIGKSITILIPRDRHSEERDILARIARGEHVNHYETVRQRKDGRLLDVSLTISPIFDSAGRIIGASKVARDISDRKATERELKRLNEELEDRVRERTASLAELVRELDTFSHTVAHDLRAPLRVMCRFAQLLRETQDSRLDESGKLFLGEIVDGTKRMDAMVTDLLGYCRMTREDIEVVPVSLDAVVRDVLRDTEDYLLERRVDLQVETPFPMVLGHRLSLTQAISNLVVNAVKFMKPEVAAKVVIRAEATRPGWIRAWVEDNGIGIEPAFHDRIFKVFERLHGREEYPGTGIGLAIVRRAAERMGGSAGVESVPGVGSRFFVELRSVPEAKGISP